MELLLVVWVDEPKGALANCITDLGNQLLKALYSHPRGSYAHQFVDVTCRGSACLQQDFVERLWQQMNERQFGGQTNAYLLMTAKWVLPSRKTKESDTILFEEVFDVKEKVSFVGWFNVFYHIVNKYEVIALILCLWLF